MIKIPSKLTFIALSLFNLLFQGMSVGHASSSIRDLYQDIYTLGERMTNKQGGILEWIDIQGEKGPSLEKGHPFLKPMYKKARSKGELVNIAYLKPVPPRETYLKPVSSVDTKDVSFLYEQFIAGTGEEQSILFRGMFEEKSDNETSSYYAWTITKGLQVTFLPSLKATLDNPLPSEEFSSSETFSIDLTYRAFVDNEKDYRYQRKSAEDISYVYTYKVPANRSVNLTIMKGIQHHKIPFICDVRIKGSVVLCVRDKLILNCQCHSIAKLIKEFPIEGYRLNPTGDEVIFTVEGYFETDINCLTFKT